MCDEFTGTGDGQATADTGLTRRNFAAMGAAAVVAGYVVPAPTQARALALAEGMVTVNTPDGACDAFFVHPARGRHPGVILWPDAIGLRDTKKSMARRLAAEGYAVLVVNQYYRTAPAPLGLDFAAFRTPEGRAKIGPLMGSLTPEAVSRDAVAHVAFLDAQRVVDKRRKIGTQGYCMGGAMALRTAAAVPGRVGAAASLHGGSLVTDRPDSPHRLLAASRASYLIAVARDDDAKAPGDKDELRRAAVAAGRHAEIEVYAANHSWCVPDAPAFDLAEAVRAYSRILALYRRL